MKTIKLQKLKLTNFKGVRDMEADFNGKEVGIYGANGTGKTTMADAYLWLLFGKDSTGRKDFCIRTLDKGNNPIEHLDHEVCAQFLIEGHGEVSLRKNLTERWEKKRGQQEATFCGTQIDCYVNEVPVKASEYAVKVSELFCTERIFRCLTHNGYFMSQSKDARREMLVEMAGDITKEDIISKDEELRELEADLANKTMEELRKQINSQKAKIHKDIENIPERIEEINRMKPEPQDPDTIRAEMEAAKKELKELVEQLSDSNKASNAIAEERKRIMDHIDEAKEKMNAFRLEYKNSVNQSYIAAKNDYLARENEMLEIDFNIQRKDKEANKYRMEIQELEKALTALRAEYRRIKAERPIINEIPVCPVCGRAFEGEDAELIKAEKMEQFARDIKEREEKNIQEGLKIKEEIEELEARETEARETVKKLKIKLGSLAEQNTAEPPTEPKIKEDDIMSRPEMMNYSARINELQKQLCAIKDRTDEAHKDEMGKRMDELTKIIVDKKSKLRNEEQSKKMDERMAELSKQHMDGTHELWRLERKGDLLMRWRQSMMAIMEERIDSYFEFVSFKMFRNQLNGGVDEVCDAVVDGVPYPDLNTAGRMKADLDIINAIGKRYGILAPVFVDGRESVTRIPQMGAQTISLFVSPEDKKLRIENGTKKMR